MQRSQRRLNQLELDRAALTASAQVLTAALAGGRHLTREELFARLTEAGIPTTGQRGYHILVQHAMAGLICCGAPAGKQPNFTLLDEWVPATPALPRDTALSALARRYVRSHGPATAHDLCWWSTIRLAKT
ncbi:MAG: hypothetical protein OHK0015_36690 [Chloroflexi bacterium OHK40]